MKLTKLKQITIALMTVGVLTACGASSDKVIGTIQEQVKADEASIAELQETMTKQAEFMDTFDELLKNAAKKYEKVEEVLADVKTQAAELGSAFQLHQEALVLSEKEAEALNQLVSKLEGSESYETMQALVETYQAYKANLQALLEANVELMTTYEGFLTDISGDMPFQTLEELVTELNQGLEATQACYEAYLTEAEAFQTILMNEVK